MNVPLITVIIPTYNRAHLIERAIKSVLGQTYKEIEVFIIDDASTDNTKEVVKQFKSKCIHYIRLKTNKGVSNARNIGIEKAKGEYIAFLDSDDEWLPTKLEQQIKAFQNTKFKKIIVITCGFSFIRKANSQQWTPKLKGDVLADMLYGKIRDHQPQCWLIKKELIDINNIRFDIRMHSSEDWDFLIQLLKVGQLDYVSDILVNIYQDKDERLWNHTRQLEAIDILIDKYKNESFFNSRILSDFYVSKANMCLHLGKKQEAKSSMFNAFKLNKNRKTLLWSIIAIIILLGVDKSKLSEHLINKVRKLTFK